MQEIRLKLTEQEQLFRQYSENLEEKLEQMKSEYFELANAQTSARNEISFLEQQKCKRLKRAALNKIQRAIRPTAP